MAKSRELLELLVGRTIVKYRIKRHAYTGGIDEIFFLLDDGLAIGIQKEPKIYEIGLYEKRELFEANP